MTEAKHIVLAGGCFWGLQALMDSFRGICATVVGYANAREAGSLGSVEAQMIPFLKDAGIPACGLSYQTVCSGLTGATEAVAIKYDARVIALDDILGIFFTAIDPTSKDRQGNDVGTQYKSGVYYLPCEREDTQIIERKLREIQKAHQKPVVTEMAELENFSIAEEMHQKYLENRPGGYCHISVSAIKERFAHLL